MFVVLEIRENSYIFDNKSSAKAVAISLKRSLIGW